MVEREYALILLRAEKDLSHCAVIAPILTNFVNLGKAYFNERSANRTSLVFSSFLASLASISSTTLQEVQALVRQTIIRQGTLWLTVW